MQCLEAKVEVKTIIMSIKIFDNTLWNSDYSTFPQEQNCYMILKSDVEKHGGTFLYKYENSLITSKKLKLGAFVG